MHSKKLFPSGKRNILKTVLSGPTANRFRKRFPARGHYLAKPCIQVNSRFMKTLILVVLLAPVCQAQTSGTVPKPPWAKPPAAKTAPPQDDNTIKVDVKLVNVFVTVTD